MKKKITTLFLLALGAGMYAQTPDPIGMGVGTALVPNKSAILDIAANNKGVLIPRITLIALDDFSLEGGSKTESMLVYNEKGSLAKGFYYWTKDKTDSNKGKWELITSESVLNEKITEVKNYVKDEISKITQIGTGTDLSYVVVFTPDATGSSTGKFEYLETVVDPNTKDVTYVKKEITLKDLVLMSETKTYMNVEMHKVNDPKFVKDPANPTAPVPQIDAVKAYWYYNEEAVNAWLKVDGNDIKDILDPVKGIGFDDKKAGVFKIDVIDAVSKNWSYLFENNKEVIKEVLKNTPGNVFVKEIEVPGKPGEKTIEIYYVDENGKEQPLDFNALETKTRITRGAIGTDGKVAKYDEAGLVEPTTPEAIKKAEGQVIFRYAGEEKGTYDYLNITEEVRTALTHNTVKEELSKYLSKGGSVYYGEIVDGDGKNVLYRIVIDPITGQETKEIIDISENIIREITNNDKIIDLINEKTKEIIKTGVTTETGEVIGEFKVFKTIVSATVDQGKTSDDTLVDYNTQFNKDIELAQFSRLLNVEILDENGQVILNTVTDVKVVSTDLAKSTITFRFGVGKMYAPLASGKKYDVILRYISNQKFEIKYPKTKP
ncbi:hypothetical protein VSP10_09925 [Myroides odoratimimus]|uniref:hypothetical protein n=1 Tax=Myroides odoratimimus TaxID=76832 RepID=UPI002DB72AC3|nr:hypothetical protein [Myroides odoratimimus]MEC4053112.1 hypothetical protein [Myroides odoratimimus]